MEPFMSRHIQICEELPATGGSSHFSWTSLWSRLERVMEVRRQRRALLSLDDRMLKDIGLSRADAWLEGNRPLLDLPDSSDPMRHWR
jgi:uncharacterized protein YjiS (DUF1127 family)